jgi:hypothetical protein
MKPSLEEEGADIRVRCKALRSAAKVCCRGCRPGMHGAAMAWTLLMQPHAAAVELWPKPEGVWRCYEHTAQWAGLLYRRWANPDPDLAGEYTRVRSTRPSASHCMLHGLTCLLESSWCMCHGLKFIIICRSPGTCVALQAHV